jgi:predicted esterase
VWLFRTARAEVAALEAALAGLTAGEDPLRGVTGVWLRAHRSPVDGDLTTYSLRVPEDYDPGRAWPLVVHLHGRGKLRPFLGHRAPDYGQRVIVLAPFGKGAADYMGPAEADVLAALDEARRLYRVDEDRIYLAGASMGGTGAWHLAVHYPHRFAALVAASANADDRVWEELWEEPAETPPEGSVGWALKRMERLDSPVTYAANLGHVPSRVIHGDEDQVVPVGHARSMVRALREAGAPTEYHEMVGLGHNVSYGETRPEQAEWLLQHTRAARPSRFSYRTDGRWPGAYWVTRIRPDAPLRLAEVSAEAAGGAVRLQTSACRALEIDLESAPLQAGGPVAVSVDGREVGEFARSGLYLTRSGAGWVASRRPTAAEPGEMAAVFRERFAVIYGTSGDDARLKDALRRESLRLAADWRGRYFGSPPVLADREVPEEMLRERGLVLFGGPRENAVTARALELLSGAGRRPPFTFGEAGAGVDGFPGPEGDPPTLGLQFTWPSPFSEGRRLAVVWGRSWRALAEVNNRFGNRFDWTVHENRRWFGYALFDEKSAGPESLVRVGLFGPGWSLDPGLCWSREAGAGRELPGRAPLYTSLAEAGGSDGEEVWLDEVLPDEVAQFRGPVGFARGWGGGELTAGAEGASFSRGLGVRAPSRLLYRLGGAFRRFTAKVGADLAGRRPGELAPPRVKYGAMVFVVSGDGRELGRSDPLGPADPAADISVDVSGVDRLELEVFAAGKYDWHLGAGAWAQARLRR